VIVACLLQERSSSDLDCFLLSAGEKKAAASPETIFKLSVIAGTHIAFGGLLAVTVGANMGKTLYIQHLSPYEISYISAKDRPLIAVQHRAYTACFDQQSATAIANNTCTCSSID
jgi:hypothetical protein